MIRQVCEALGATIAFTVGAVCVALVLDMPSVQSYLGLTAHTAADWYQSGFSYFGVAALAGLVVDAARYGAARLAQHAEHAP